MQRKAILRVFDSLAWIEDQLDELQSIDQKRTLEIRESPHVGGQIQFNGKQLVDFGSNDYLGLSANVKLVDAIKTQAGFVGWGAGASPLISGRGTLHTRLENRSEEHTSELQSLTKLVCRLLLEKKKSKTLRISQNGAVLKDSSR